jgi:hypothetical protein
VCGYLGAGFREAFGLDSAEDRSVRSLRDRLRIRADSRLCGSAGPCYLGGMATPVTVPRELPFLEGLSWYDSRWRDLEQLDMLRRYETGWRWRGLLAEPSPEELAFIRELTRVYGSVIRP